MNSEETPQSSGSIPIEASGADNHDVPSTSYDSMIADQFGIPCLSGVQVYYRRHDDEEGSIESSDDGDVDFDDSLYDSAGPGPSSICSVSPVNSNDFDDDFYQQLYVTKEQNESDEPSEQGATGNTSNPNEPEETEKTEEHTNNQGSFGVPDEPRKSSGNKRHRKTKYARSHKEDDSDDSDEPETQDRQALRCKEKFLHAIDLMVNSFHVGLHEGQDLPKELEDLLTAAEDVYVDTNGLTYKQIERCSDFKVLFSSPLEVEFRNPPLEKPSNKLPVIVAPQGTWLNERNVFPALFLLERARQFPQGNSIPQASARHIINNYVNENNSMNTSLIRLEGCIVLLLVLRDSMINETPLIWQAMKYIVTEPMDYLLFQLEVERFLSQQKKKLVLKATNNRISPKKQRQLWKKTFYSDFYRTMVQEVYDSILAYNDILI